jgi:hypothetical protein
MLQVKWNTCGTDSHWCDFFNVNLGNLKGAGVYIIWHEGNPGRVVRIGQGDIAARLRTHRNDTEITAYARHGTLRVTWAIVSAAQQDGVETYLADQWPPLVGDAFPDCERIAVNHPW